VTRSVKLPRSARVQATRKRIMILFSHCNYSSSQIYRGLESRLGASRGGDIAAQHPPLPMDALVIFATVRNSGRHCEGNLENKISMIKSIFLDKINFVCISFLRSGIIRLDLSTVINLFESNFFA